MKHCGNCKYGKAKKPQEPCLDCKNYNEETSNNNWECENNCKKEEE